MAVFGFAQGYNYGNPYLNSLIWGGVNNEQRQVDRRRDHLQFRQWAYLGDPGRCLRSDRESVRPPHGWNSEKTAFRTALQLYENVADLQFQAVDDSSERQS